VSLTRRELLELAIVSAVTPFAGAAAAQTPAAPGVSFTSLRRDVGIFTGRGGTIGWLVTPDAVVVLDSQFPDTARPCLDGLKSRTARPIDLLVNTHHHPDHTSGNVVFQPGGPKHCRQSECAGAPEVQCRRVEHRGLAGVRRHAL
jgi:glyoxylase-like metal-dependent hydrolase (beta-lactamase superfamily II)